VGVENFFFVRQAGVFLFCLGLFYLVPLADLENHHRVIDIMIVTKILAVFFLVGNTGFVPRPGVILLAAAGDAIMAILLIFFSLKAKQLFRKKI
jgi:hypothetical protein